MDGYTHYRNHFTNKHGQLQVLAATDDTTLITPKTTSHQIFLQKLYISITTYAAQTWTFQDSTGTPVPNGLISIPGAAVALNSESSTIVIDFGPEGYAIPVGKNLVLNVSAAGAAGVIVWDAYEKLGAVINYLSGASNQ